MARRRPSRPRGRLARLGASRGRPLGSDEAVPIAGLATDDHPDGRWRAAPARRSPRRRMGRVAAGGRIAYAVRNAAATGCSPTTRRRDSPGRFRSKLRAVSLRESGPRISAARPWLAATSGNEISLFPSKGELCVRCRGTTRAGRSSAGAPTEPVLYAHRIGDVPAQVVRINVATRRAPALKEIAPMVGGLWRIFRSASRPMGAPYAYHVPALSLQPVPG